MAKKLDWSKLPPTLAYLVGPAEKYGHYQFEDRIFEFLRGMSEPDKQELTVLVQRTIPDNDEIDRWLDEYSMTKHREAALVYFFQHLLALGNDAGFFD
jgi:hypothetical protein